jgi:hypothetical protein
MTSAYCAFFGFSFIVGGRGVGINARITIRPKKNTDDLYICVSRIQKFKNGNTTQILVFCSKELIVAKTPIIVLATKLLTEHEYSISYSGYSDNGAQLRRFENNFIQFKNLIYNSEKLKPTDGDNYVGKRKRVFTRLSFSEEGNSVELIPTIRDDDYHDLEICTSACIRGDNSAYDVNDENDGEDDGDDDDDVDDVDDVDEDDVDEDDVDEDDVDEDDVDEDDVDEDDVDEDDVDEDDVDEDDTSDDTRRKVTSKRMKPNI